MATENLPPPSDDDPSTQLFDVDTDAPAASVPDSGEGGKLKMIVSLLKRCLGVKDIAAMRLSLPASLLEPMPNLEYWQYLDRPDLFAAINDSEDPFQRMLAVLRFTFSKELKFIRGKICKPYNSVLGEHFRAHWDIIPVRYSSDPCEPPTQHLYVAAPAPAPSHGKSEIGSVKSAQSSRLNIAENKNDKNGDAVSVKSTGSGGKKNGISGIMPQAAIGETNLAAGMSDLSLANSAYNAETGELIEGDIEGGDRVRVVYLTEQVSHHPPISSYFMTCPARQVSASGVDQIAAKVSGTTIRVSPGVSNKGIFVRIDGGHGEGERYQITHPTAQVNGVLRGSFYATVAESTIITATGGNAKEKYRVILDYKEESWLGKPQFALEGVVHTYVPGETAHEAWTRIKHVPKDCIVAQVEGSWRQRIKWKRVNESEWKTLLDLSTLHVIPKTVRPLSRQNANESRKLWEHVTSNLLKKEYSEATKMKLAIEQRQRDLAAERKKKGIEFQPVFFEKDIESGESRLTAEGRKAVEAELVQREVETTL